MVAGLSHVAGVGAGVFHSLAFTDDGRRRRTPPSTTSASSAHGTTDNRTVPTRSHNPDRIVAVVAGWYHSLAIAATGTTSAWGWNHFGQLGNGTTANALRPVRVPGMDPSAVSAGVAHTVAVTARGA
jgi:alpha-tubulin suppressor-like RCC1 family protein